jgi:acetylornithine deacetylase/succinyl-diaminopimelate desuccinylase-like protein
MSRWLLLAVVALAAPAQNFDAILATIQADQAWTLEQQTSICEIPAPPFKEKARGEEYAKRLSAHGLIDVRIDSEGNVISRWPGSKSPKPLIVLSAHLDTVFPEGMDVTVKRDGEKLRGLGMGDDCRGLASVLSVARAFQQHKAQFNGTILFVATVGEEGQGDLRGVRHLFTRELKGQVDAFISVDGTGLSMVTRAVGSNRYLVTYKGRGGHSYGAFGMPNPAHAMGRAIARIADIQVPASPKTTFNIGRVEGGTSVNSVPISVSMEVDMRSESASELASLDERMRAAFQHGLNAEKARWPASSAPPVFTIEGKYTTRGWTEWTQGFQYGSAILQFDATGEGWHLDSAAGHTINLMAPHVTHFGVHDHGFNNVSTYGNLLRLMRRAVRANPWEKEFYELALKALGAVQAGAGPRIRDGGGYIYSFNGPHSLFADTIRSLRALAVATSSATS